MRELTFDGAGDGALVRADARLGSGLWLVTGGGPAALATLVALAAGVQSPRHGRVLLDGKPPYTSPELRREVATLLATETLPTAPNVADAMARVQDVRGDVRGPDAVLVEFGLQGFARRRVTDLDATERRALALALALSHPRPRLLALYEPFATGGRIGPERIRGGVLRAAAEGAVVVLALAHPREALGLDVVSLELDQGVLRAAPPTLGPAHGFWSLTAHASDPRALVAALAREPAVTGVNWNSGDPNRTVIVSGAEIEALASALGRAATAAGVALERVAPTVFAAPGFVPAGPMSGVSASAPHAVAFPDASRGTTPDQSVAMPTAFADPTGPAGPKAGA